VSKEKKEICFVLTLLGMSTSGMLTNCIQGCKNFWVLKVLGIMAAESVRSSRLNKNEDIFSYMSRVDKEVEGVEKLGESVVIPKCMRVRKIMMALDRYSEYKSFQEKLKPETVREELHKVHSNKLQMRPTDFEMKEVGLHNKTEKKERL